MSGTAPPSAPTAYVSLPRGLEPLRGDTSLVRTVQARQLQHSAAQDHRRRLRPAARGRTARREGRNRGRGQVAGVGWAQAEAVAARAADSGNLQGVRDAAIILVMSDTLARISEVVALQCSDVEPETTTSGGTVHIRASKTDQLGGRRYALHRAVHARRDQRLPGGVRTRRRPAVSPGAARWPRQ